MVEVELLKLELTDSGLLADFGGTHVSGFVIEIFLEIIICPSRQKYSFDHRSSRSSSSSSRSRKEGRVLYITVYIYAVGSM
jgi:hypothetical protein